MYVRAIIAWVLKYSKFFPAPPSAITTPEIYFSTSEIFIKY